MVYPYQGYYYSDDSECWVALLGGTEYTRGFLESMLSGPNSDEQKAEIRKALSALPAHHVLPKRGQRKLIPAEGDIA